MPSSRSLLVLVILAVLSLSLLGCCAACGPSCMAGYYYLERPSFNYSSNGCGSYGISISAPFGADPCCTSHDYCYSNCSTTKPACDTGFDGCLTAQCGTLDSTADQDACKAQARLFYTAVMDLGCPAYSSAQDAACECSTSRNGTGNATTYYMTGGAAGMVGYGGGGLYVVVMLAVLAVGAVSVL